MTLLPAAIGIVFDPSEKHLLLVKRKDIPVWVLPGGGIEKGEKVEEALLREIEEETGCLPKIERKSALYTPINKLASQAHVFVCKAPYQELFIASDEVEEAAFYPLEKLPSSFFFLHRDWLFDALHSKEMIEKPISQVTYCSLLKHLLLHPKMTLSFAWTYIRTRWC